MSIENPITSSRFVPAWVLAMPSDDAARRVSAWIYGTVLALAGPRLLRQGDAGYVALLAVAVVVAVVAAHRGVRHTKVSRLETA